MSYATIRNSSDYRSTDIPTYRSETWKRADFQSSARLGIDVVLGLEIFPDQERPRLVYTLWEVLALNAASTDPLVIRKIDFTACDRSREENSPQRGNHR